MSRRAALGQRLASELGARGGHRLRRRRGSPRRPRRSRRASPRSSRAVSTAVTSRPSGLPVLVGAARCGRARRRARCRTRTPPARRGRAARARRRPCATRRASACGDRVRVLVGDRAAQRLVGARSCPPAASARVAASRYRFCATRWASPSCASLWLSSERTPAGTARTPTAIIGQDHDDDEEQPQAVAEARREEVAKAHARRGNIAASGASPRRTYPATIGVHGAGRKSCCRPTRGYSSVGRAPGSHPGGRGFESP